MWRLATVDVGWCQLASVGSYLRDLAAVGDEERGERVHEGLEGAGLGGLQAGDGHGPSLEGSWGHGTGGSGTREHKEVT